MLKNQNTKRIFTAIDISDRARARISEYIENLRREFPDLRAGWEKPEKLHLTLKFLGDIDEFQLKSLERIVAETAQQITDFNLQIGGTGVFPNTRNARILWLGIKDENENLAQINEILETECEKIGFPPEKRNFKPHLTIARLREPHKSRELAEKHLSRNFQSEEFKVNELVIYESKLKPMSSVYMTISKHKFQ